jgi:hypothetical protein
MRNVLVILALTACGRGDDRMLPGESTNDDLALRESSPCSGTSDYDGNGTIDITWTYTYDDFGRSTMDRGHYIDGSAVPDDVYAYRWDNTDHLMSLVETSGNQLVWKLEYSFDTLGNELGSSQVDVYSDPEHPSTITTTNHDFDDHGRPAYANVTTTGMPDVKSVYIYDDLGRLVERDDDRMLDGTIDDRTYVVYDDVGRATITTFTGADGSHSVRTRRYDEELRVIEIITDRFDTMGVEHLTDMTVTYVGERMTEVTTKIDGATFAHETYAYGCASRSTSTGARRFKMHR